MAIFTGWSENTNLLKLELLTPVLHATQ